MRSSFERDHGPLGRRFPLAPDSPVEDGREFLLRLVPQLPVHVERNARLRVAEHLLDRVYGCAVPNRE